MKYVLILSLVFVLLIQYEPVQGQEICDFEDDECLTAGANNLFKNTVAGIPCLIKPSDPLYMDAMRRKTLCVDYIISNSSLVGLKNCTVIQTSLNETAMTYKHTLSCPKLIYNFNFNGEGTFNVAEINGEGNAILTTGEYEIIIRGKFGQFISKKDHKPHLFLRTYYIETNAIGRMVLESDNLNVDREKGEETLNYINDNYEILVKFFRYPVMDKSMAILLKAVNKYLRTLPVDKVFPKID